MRKEVVLAIMAALPRKEIADSRRGHNREVVLQASPNDVSVSVCSVPWRFTIPDAM